MAKDFDFDDEDDFDEYKPRRKAKSASGGAAALRFLSPGTFGIAILLFFLPWTDFGCNGPTGKMQLVTQSGYQSASGGISEGDGIKQMKEMNGIKDDGKKNKEFKLSDLNPPGAAKGKGKNDSPEKAYLLWLYLALLAAGAIVPALIGATKMRGLFLTAFSAAATLVLVLQMVLGFPLSKAASEANKEFKEGMAKMGKNAGPGPAMPGMPNLDGKMEITSHYLVSFWLTILLLVGSLALGIIQVGLGGGNKKPKRRRREEPEDDYDDDDEDDPDEDDRPRRRSRR